jgi:PST family polysaccharide transporter
VVTFILAAIVGPSTFGLVAMAMVYVAFVQMLVRQGMIPALVQRRQLDQEHVNSAFWMILGTGTVLTAGSILLSGWWAALNRTPDLEPVINALSVVVILQSLIVVPEALLSRQMDFRGLALRANSAALLGGVVGLALAVTGFGVWALVAQHIVKAVVDVIVLWRLTEWRPGLTFHWRAAKDLFGFSLNATVAGFGDFVNSRVDALVIGLFFGPTAVGLYRLAARLVDLVVEVTVRSFHAVALPELSRLQDDRRQFADRIRRMINSSALIGLPGLAILAGASEPLMAVMGAEWAAAAAPLSVLCLAGAVAVLTMFTGPVAMSVGKPHVLALVVWVSAAISSVSYVVAGFLLADASVDSQVLGIAMSRVALVSTAGLILGAWVITRNSDNSLRSLGKAAALPTLLAAVAFAITRALAEVTWPGGDVVGLVLTATVSTLATGALLFAVDSTLRSRVALATRKVLAK